MVDRIRRPKNIVMICKYRVAVFAALWKIFALQLPEPPQFSDLVAGIFVNDVGFLKFIIMFPIFAAPK